MKELHKLTESAQCFSLQDVLLGRRCKREQDDRMSLEKCAVLTQGPMCEMSSDFIAFFFFFFFLRLHSVCLVPTASQRSLSCARSISISLGMFTIWCSSDDWAPMMFFTQTNKSTFIIQCDKLTWKMSATFYTYMNFCVRSLSARLFCSRSIAEGFEVHMRVHFLSTLSDRSPFALVNLVINFGRFP